MGCLCSKPNKNEIRTPKVIRSPVPKGTKVSQTDLPLGIRLTGGAALRQDGYDGTGVRVAVIDSGIDEKHPGFEGQVQRKVWYRAGTPLSEDDHGTHVAGTIHLMAPKAEIYDYRVFGRTGNLTVDAAIAQAIRVAAGAWMLSWMDGLKCLLCLVARLVMVP